MTRYQILPLLAAGVFLLVGFAVSAVNSSSNKNQPVVFEDRLAVQKAMALGNSLLMRGKAAEAVETLEAELAHIDGNRRYLTLLRDAYKAHITNLYFNNKNDLAQKYLRRLRILDPKLADQLTINPDAKVTKAGSPTQQKSPSAKATSAPQAKEKKADFVYSPKSSKTASKVVKEQPAAPKTPQPKVRANNSNNDEMDDPFSSAHALDGEATPAQSRLARELLNRAEQKYRLRQYEDARILYEKAYQTNKTVIADSTDRWAYCKLNHVVNQLNLGATKKDELARLEQDVRTALSMAPRLAPTGKTLLEQINKRRRTTGTSTQGRAVSATKVAVQHHAAKDQSWQIAETQHFRIFHHEQRTLGEQVAQIAEQTRSKMLDKWFGSSAKPWRRKCDIFLHATGEDYSRATGVPSHSPGHSRIETDPHSREVVRLRMDLRCDRPDLLQAILPHETTHVVLAGQFGPFDVPRWVDEGIAVLSEPQDKIEGHKTKLAGLASDKELFAIKELMQLPDYPSARRIVAFYSQSVSLVQFLSQKKGPRVFTQFVRDGLRDGSYQRALQRHYGYRDFSELQNRWSQIALRGGGSTGYVSSKR